MRKIITTTFITLDGVMQAPGGSEEDTSSGFKYGGWQFGKYDDELSGKMLNQFMTIPFELLLGRRTYDIFSGFWPKQSDDTPFAKPFNTTKKYVVSHNSFEPSWSNSKLITGDNVVEEIKRLKDMDAPDLWVWGSGNLIQTLLKNNLIDQMHLWIHPVTIGSGKKLFAEGTQPEQFTLTESKVTSTGVLIATYDISKPLKLD